MSTLIYRIESEVYTSIWVNSATSLPRQLALAKELVLGECLVIVPSPRREIWVKVRLIVLFDVRGCREVWRVTSNVHRVGRLVHAHPVHRHRRREMEVFEVDESESGRDTEVKNDVQRLLRYRTGGDLRDRVGS
jgi:hypothetical protein